MAEAVQGLGALYDQALPNDGIIVPQEITPFGQFLDQAVNALERVSHTEFDANAKIQAYAAGQGSMDDALIAATKMSLEVQAAVNIVNQVVTTFREIQQIQV